MKRLNHLFHFYINSSIHVALAVFSLTYITYLELDVGVDFNLLWFNFFATVLGYNFVKYFGLAQFHYRSLTGRLKSIQIFSLVCILAMGYFVVQLPIQTTGYILVFALVTFLYAIPMLPKEVLYDEHHNLREIGGLKVYIVAFVWCGVTVFLPWLNQEIHPCLEVLLLGVQRFLFVLVLMFPFEIRDLKYDSIKLATIPQKIGVKATQYIGLLLLGVIFMVELFKDVTSTFKILLLGVILFITGLFLLGAKITSKRNYSAFWVESIPIIWLALWLLFA